MWKSKTVITGIVTGIIAIAKAVGEGSGAFEVPTGAVEALLAVVCIFLRMGVEKSGHTNPR